MLTGKGLAAATAAFLVLAAPALADPPAADQGAAPVTRSPSFTTLDPADAMARYYPTAALRAGTEGRTTLHCSVTAAGHLTDCSVLKEEPAGAGFGAASLQLAKIFRLNPMKRDGVPVDGGSYTFGIHWKIPPHAVIAAPLKTGPISTAIPSPN